MEDDLLRATLATMLQLRTGNGRHSPRPLPVRSCSSCGQQARSHRLENPGCGRVLLSETKHLCATEFASSAISAILSWNDSVKRFANPATFISECPRKTLHLGFYRDFGRHCKARRFLLFPELEACRCVASARVGLFS